MRPLTVGAKPLVAANALVGAKPLVALALALALAWPPAASADARATPSKPAKTEKPAKPPKPVLPIVPLPPRADDSLAPARMDPSLLDRAYKRAQTRRNVGIGLAAPGVALTVLGGVLIGFGARDPNLFAELDEIIGGVISGASGLVLGIPGVYFWSTGQDDMDSVVWRRKQLTSSTR